MIQTPVEANSFDRGFLLDCGKQTPLFKFYQEGRMEKVIGVRDLRNAGLLGTEYTELDLYDAFLMYLIVNDELDDRITLLHGNFILDNKSCFQMDNWLV